MRDFRKLTIWQEGINIVKMTYSLSKLLPKEEIYGLKSQVERAAVSIPSNIAEGCSRSSEADLNRFLEYSLGSSFELETQLIVIKEIYNFNAAHTDELITQNNNLQKMIHSFISKLNKR
jgi:four helix bundle protein